ncbi:Sec translocon accessory complex subunit YajC [Planctomycetales bacterium 10988]|nr:Sec translocon accessory complex subunit YajC [Planctomycetales bacterium 10988]
MNDLSLWVHFPWEFTTLFAQQQAQPEQPNGNWFLSSLPLMLMIVFAYYMLLIRPQQQQENRRKSMIESLKKNDRVITKGGIIGVVTGVRQLSEKSKDSEITIRTHEDTKITILGSMIEGKMVEEKATKEKAVKE